MTDTPFDEAERRELTALGFDIADTKQKAHMCGVMCIDAPGGGEISGFVPRSKIVPLPDEDQGDAA